MGRGALPLLESKDEFGAEGVCSVVGIWSSVSAPVNALECRCGRGAGGSSRGLGSQVVQWLLQTVLLYGRRRFKLCVKEMLVSCSEKHGMGS